GAYPTIGPRRPAPSAGERSGNSGSNRRERYSVPENGLGVADQFKSGSRGPARASWKKRRPGGGGVNELGTQGSGPCGEVIQRLIPCHCIPRSNRPSAPPMIRSALRKRPGPIVLANAGTSVVRLLKLVKAFCSIVRGCSRAPIRCV